jgi:hypothetical protein
MALAVWPVPLLVSIERASGAPVSLPGHARHPGLAMLRILSPQKRGGNVGKELVRGRRRVCDSSSYLYPRVSRGMGPLKLGSRRIELSFGRSNQSTVGSRSGRSQSRGRTNGFRKLQLIS